MRILWFNWKDGSHPLAGGAEVVTEQLCRRLAADGHTVHLIAGGFPGAKPTEERDGYQITRLGGRYSIYWRAWRWYRKRKSSPPAPLPKGGGTSLHSSQPYDLIIDECNTIPFFARWYIERPERSRRAPTKCILFIHQLAREIWFTEMRFPLNVIGYLLEPLYLWLLRRSDVITVSQSTKDDLVRYGFDADRVRIISEGIEVTPAEDITASDKFPQPTLLSLGALRPMKRTLDIVNAFEIAKESWPDLQLIIAGDNASAYGQRVIDHVQQSPHQAAIQILGKVDNAKRAELLQRSHALAVTSVREGWGLVVTEAAAYGTPAVVYDVPGLRDSVRHGVTGLVSEYNTPRHLAVALAALLNDQARYQRLRQAGWLWSKEITFERCYADFLAAVQ